jgi:hypothetical protein
MTGGLKQSPPERDARVQAIGSVVIAVRRRPVAWTGGVMPLRDGMQSLASLRAHFLTPPSRPVSNRNRS